MALSITKETGFGVDAIHHVMIGFYVNRSYNWIRIKYAGYSEAQDWLDKKEPLYNWQAQYQLSNMPASVITDLQNLKDTIENLLPTNEPEQWDGAIIIQDNGDPI